MRSPQRVGGSGPYYGMSAEDSGLYNALMCATEELALHRLAFYLNACQNTKSLSLGNAATSRSSIRNIHGITLGSFPAGTRCKRQLRPWYLGNPNLVDPEEAFVASLSSCHMLTFLAIACKKRFVLDEYADEAVGVMEKNSEGRLAITRVTLRQRLKFSGEKQPTPQEIEEMNHGAHEQCFIANSVKTEVKVEPQT